MLNSIRAYFRAIGYMRKNSLMWLFWFPFIITGLVIYGGTEVTSMTTEWATRNINEWIQSWDWLGEKAEVFSAVLYWIIWIVFRIGLYFFMAFLGGSIILLFMSPLLTYSSELVAQKLKADIPDFSLDRFFQDLARAMWLAIKNGGIQLLFTILCFLLGFVPIIGFLSPVFMFAISAYFFGYNFMDYTLERKALSVKESNEFVWKYKYQSIGLGMPFALWMLIPFVGPMTSGFMALIATVAATMRLETENGSFSKPVKTGQ